MRKKVFFVFGIILLVLFGYFALKKFNVNPFYTVGQEVDNFNGVSVYYNGSVNNIEERAVTRDGYNLGLKYQCVEFVKRYYYEELNHKMPDSYGHAKDFFNSSLKDGQKNNQRNLIQYANRSKTKPQINDLLVYSGSLINKYGHVSIIFQVTDDNIEIIQQNPRPFGSSREEYDLKNEEGFWIIKYSRVLGWLRKE